MQSIVGCDVILHPGKRKFLQIGRLGAGFCLSKDRFSFVKKANKKKIMTSS